MKQQDEKPTLESVRAAWREAVDNTPVVRETVITRAIALARSNDEEESRITLSDLLWGFGTSLALSLCLAFLLQARYSDRSSSDSRMLGIESVDPFSEVNFG